jgi:hypothetical protein
MRKKALIGIVTFFVIIVICTLVIPAVIENVSRDREFRIYQRDLERRLDEIVQRYNLVEGEPIDLQLYDVYEVDTSGLRRGVDESRPFTFAVQLSHPTHSSWNRQININTLNEVPIEYDDFDFNFDNYPDNRFVVSFGREIVDIRIRELHHEIGIRPVDITFAEECQGDKMFLYLMGNFSIHHPVEGGSIFIMEGTERILLVDYRTGFDARK